MPELSDISVVTPSEDKFLKIIWGFQGTDLGMLKEQERFAEVPMISSLVFCRSGSSTLNVNGGP